MVSFPARMLVSTLHVLLISNVATLYIYIYYFSLVCFYCKFSFFVIGVQTRVVLLEWFIFDVLSLCLSLSLSLSVYVSVPLSYLFLVLYMTVLVLFRNKFLKFAFVVS